MVKAVVFVSLLFSTLSFAKEIQISVDGMVCGFCAQGITKKFLAQPAIDRVFVSLENQSITLKLKADQNLEDFQLIKLVADAGFEIKKVERRP